MESCRATKNRSPSQLVLMLKANSIFTPFPSPSSGITTMLKPSTRPLDDTLATESVTRRIRRIKWHTTEVGKAWFSAYHRHNKEEVIKSYGGHCLICGEIDPAVLTIDHIFDDGAEERKIRYSGASFYRFLKKQGFPKDRYQLLCMNCNFRKRVYGPDPKIWPKHFVES